MNNQDEYEEASSFDDIEHRLNQLIDNQCESPAFDTDTLVKLAQKQQRQQELIQLGAHGIFAVLLSFLIPIFIQCKRINKMRKRL